MTGLEKTGWLFTIVLSCPVLAGCAPSQAQPGPELPPPVVKVSVPVTREVTDYVDFPGRMEALHSIDVRARVTGYLDKACFQEGADVKEGDLLFEIDRRPYKAALDQAVGNLVSMQARLTRLDADLGRVKRLLGTAAISQEDHDKIVGDRGEAAASIQALAAAVERAQLDLTFTKVVAAVSGRISRRYIDPGNLVKADDTILTSIVSLDPIYAYFDADERTTLRLQRLIRAQKIKWSPGARFPVQLGLADEDGFSRDGVINFADNRVDADTGTWRLRGVFANPDHALAPGLFVRMRAPVGEPYRATLVCEQALSTDQGRKNVYVVKNKIDPDTKKPVEVVEYRLVHVGRLHDGLRVITDGLAPDEKIVVSGLQRIRAGIEVKAEVVDMPVVGEADKETGRQGDKERERQGDKQTRREGE